MSGYRGHRRDGGDPLALDPVTMRELGYRTVDMLVAQLQAVPDGPALRRAAPEEMAAHVPDGPGGPRDFEALLGELEEHVLPYMSRCDHPRYFAFIPACGTFPAALGDFIASALNIYAGCGWSPRVRAGWSCCWSSGSSSGSATRQGRRGSS